MILFSIMAIYYIIEGMTKGNEPEHPDSYEKVRRANEEVQRRTDEQIKEIWKKY